MGDFLICRTTYSPHTVIVRSLLSNHTPHMVSLANTLELIMCQYDWLKINYSLIDWEVVSTA